MSEENKTPSAETMPFRVTPIGKPREILKGFADMENAVADCDARNKRARDWGILTSYQAIPRP